MKGENMIVSRELLNYSGRFDFTNEIEPECAWPNSSISINFEGDKLSAELESDGCDYFLVVLDGRIHINCLPVKSRKIHILVQDIEHGKHRVELVKRTESYMGTATFYGFNIHEGRLLEKDEEKKLKIELFGDSITCGQAMYGDENSPYEDINSNSYLSYGAVAARALNADVHITSWSGRGLVRNYDDSPHPLPDRIGFITQKHQERVWDFNNYIPDIVVINLGTNDKNQYPPTREVFVNTYRKFVNRLRGYYGIETKIICALGPLIKEKTLHDMREYIKYGVTEYLNLNGDKNVYFLEFQQQDLENGLGQCNHPTPLTHALMAKELKKKINEILN